MKLISYGLERVSAQTVLPVADLSTYAFKAAPATVQMQVAVLPGQEPHARLTCDRCRTASAPFPLLDDLPDGWTFEQYGTTGYRSLCPTHPRRKELS